MNICRISTQIREMSEAKVDADMGAWRDVFSKFDKAVEECFDVDMLVKCLLEDEVITPTIRHLSNRIKLRGLVSALA